MSAVVLLPSIWTNQANHTIVYTYFDLAPQGEQGYTYTTNIIGALNGVNSAGAFIRCIISAWAADAYGRKRTIQLGCVILVVGGALCAGSADIGMFLAGRVIAGIGSGVLAGECCLPSTNEHVLMPKPSGSSCVPGRDLNCRDPWRHDVRNWRGLRTRIRARWMARIRVLLLPSRLAKRDLRLALSSRDPVCTTFDRLGWKRIHTVLAALASVQGQTG